MAPKKKSSGPAAAAAKQPKRPAATSSTTTTKAPVPPRPLTPRARALLLLALPLTVAGFGAGVAGMLVLLDPAHPLAASAFGTAWRVLLTKNLFVQPFLFNFGAIASVAIAARLVEGRRAVLSAQVEERRRRVDVKKAR